MFVLAGTARADRISRLINTLENGSGKQRLSAALSLANSGNKRAIKPLYKALGYSNRTVRGVAATALRKLVDGSVSGTVCNLNYRQKAACCRRIVSKLRSVSKSDSSSFVRSQARKAASAISCGGGSTSKVYVNIGPMGDKTSRSRTWKRVMSKATRKALNTRTNWRTTGRWTRSRLKQKKMEAFHVRGTLTKLNVSGGSVACKVSMLLATYPAKSVFGFLNGGASVEAGNSARDRKFASRACIEAVVSSLMLKIIGTIKIRLP